MDVELILVPYDSGHKGIRTGCGPIRFLEHGLDRILRDQGHKVAVQQIDSRARLTTEIGTTFELARNLAVAVRSAIDRKAFPIVLAGNCNSCVGTVAGLDPSELGIVWLDAHGDFNTPETTESGFLDGMGLAMVTGRCWKALLRTIPVFGAVADANVVHIGSRDLDAEEERMLKQSDIQLVSPNGMEASSIRSAVKTALVELRKRVNRVYLHVDLDVLHIAGAEPNHLAVPGGLSVQLVEELIVTTRELFEVCALAITSFDPACDSGNRVLRAGIRLLEAATR
ncbi:MAG: arginase family protein [Anaerolineae bacterium]|nr:arginase family protein [Anaerolineae bacterium]